MDEMEKEEEEEGITVSNVTRCTILESGQQGQILQVREAFEHNYKFELPKI